MIQLFEKDAQLFAFFVLWWLYNSHGLS